MCSGYMLPKWDLVIDCLEKASTPLDGQQETSFVSRSAFCRALTCAGISLSRSELLKLLDWIDPEFTGTIDWIEFVKSDGPPYYLGGKNYLRVRHFFQKCWRIIHVSCQKSENTAEDSEFVYKGILRLESWMLIIKNNLSNYDSLEVLDVHLLSKISEVCSLFQSPAKPDHIDYENLIKHYAGESALWEDLLRRKWELIWNELGCRWDDASHVQLETVLTRPEVGRCFSFIGVCVIEKKLSVALFDLLRDRLGLHLVCAQIY